MALLKLQEFDTDYFTDADAHWVLERVKRRKGSEWVATNLWNNEVRGRFGTIEEAIAFLEKKSRSRVELVRARGAQHRTAIQREELEHYERMTDEQLQQLEQPEFHDVIDAMMTDLARMEEMVTRRKQMFDRMKKIRFAEELEATRGKVVELSDIVMMLTEQPGRVSWTKLMASLREMRPELDDLLRELEQQHTGKPAPMIKKYRRTEEPKTWKSKPHVPLRGASVRTAQDDLQERRLLRRLNRWLDGAISTLLPMVEQRLERAASFIRANRYQEGPLLDEIETAEQDMRHYEDLWQAGRIDESTYLETVNELADELDRLEQQLRATQHNWRKI